MALEEDYRALREAAVIGSTSPRAQVAVAGRDRASYLQGLLTNDIQALTPGSGCYSVWLSPQGRMLTDMHVLQSESMILLDLPVDVAEATVGRLEQFIFSEDVQVGSMAEAMTGVWVHGPQAAALLERVLHGATGVGALADYQHLQLALDGAPVSVARIDQLGVPGYCAFLERTRESQLVEALRGAGAVHAAREALDAARIEAGYPVFGVDMTDTTIPLEAGIESRAISFTKGCYVGQEVIIRVLHRGGGRVAKKLVAVRIDGGTPAHGARIFGGGREIGAVTTGARSPRNGAIALGYVHRDFIAPGTSVEIDVDDRRVPAVVAETPLTP